jgi:hypothetical protein
MIVKSMHEACIRCIENIKMQNKEEMAAAIVCDACM